MSRRSWLTAALGGFVVVAAGAAPFTCAPLAADWGFEPIDTMKTPDDGPLSCDLSLPASDGLATQRAGCAFGKGDHASQTLGIGEDLGKRIPIRHVIILMKENRSFDHLFAQLRAQGAAYDNYSNPDNGGVQVKPFRAHSSCIQCDPGHQAGSVATTISNGDMSGFVKNAAATTGTNGHFAMSYYDADYLPFYYWLASAFALSDRHFAPMASGTYGNRNFFLFGSEAGVVNTGVRFPDPNTPSIMRTLMTAKEGYTWAVYADDEPFSGSLGWDATSPGVHPLQDLYDALDKGKDLPNVAFVDTKENVEDDHPPADLQVGEAQLRKIYLHAVGSKTYWPRLAMFWTYDEAGSFADHVRPPNGCQAKPANSPFIEMGPRIPLVAISPWAKRGYVSHVVHDHTAITRFIETIFDLPALTARDANSDALMDLFDFSCAQKDKPIPAPPEAGKGGCPTPLPACSDES